MKVSIAVVFSYLLIECKKLIKINFSKNNKSIQKMAHYALIFNKN